MRRRDILLALSGAALAPLGALAQRPAMPLVGILGAGSAEEYERLIVAFRRGLSEGGYVEGGNVAIEARWAEGHYERLPGLAAELVRNDPAMIFASGGVPPSSAAKAVTSTVPVVFTIGGDPVAAGLVASIAHPGGNLTGVSFLTSPLVTKRLELLREIMPKTAKIGVLVNPNGPTSKGEAKLVQAAAGAQPVFVAEVGASADFAAAFAGLAERKPIALIVTADVFLQIERNRMVELAARYAIPTAYFERTFVDAGGLLSYGADLADTYRQAGLYAARILNGDKPADLPVLQATKFELVINLRTAKALGLVLPDSVLARADEVIE